MESYKHLRINKEQRQNLKRVGTPPHVHRRSNKIEHGRQLQKQIPNVIESQAQRPKSIPNSVVLRLPFRGFLDFDDLEKHGVSFVSMQGENVSIGFADEKGLKKFSTRLQMLINQDDQLTYAQLFEAIDSIGSWERKDRLGWALSKQGFPATDTFRLDIELWPLGDAVDEIRQRLRSGFEGWLATERIKKTDCVNHDDLLIYRVEVAALQAEKLLEHNDVRYVELPPSTGVSYHQLNLDVNELPENIQGPVESAAKVCILDSGINSNHPLLKSAIADVQSFLLGNKNVDDETGHGTHVAGIALYGDLEARSEQNYWEPQLWLLSGRVLNEANEFDVEAIENTLEKAVVYFVEEYGCKIFNLSLGNANAPYNGAHVRGIAYTLDKLAREHDVLFVVAAGNFTGSENPEIPQKSWRTEYPDYLLHDASIIIDPAPALNVLTVGGYALNDATNSAQRYPKDVNELPVAKIEQPSPFTRHGPSVKKALKPELIAHGGNYSVNVRSQQQYIPIPKGLGVISCNYQFVGKTLLSESSGTSFAAPYITNLAGRLLNEYPEASANLLRAFLVNHSSMPLAVERTFSDIHNVNNQKAKRLRPSKEVAGYGKVDEDILFRSSEQAVVLYTEETIADDTYQFFELPLPTEYFQGSKRIRELRITLSYMPPVRPSRIEYRGSRLWFRLVKGKSLDEVQKHFNKQEDVTSKGDTATSNREIGPQMRDRGTVQSDVWRLKQPKKGDKWFVVVLRNDYAWAKGQCKTEEPYALVVSAADRENEHAQLYTQISQQLQHKAQIRQRV